MLGEHCYAQELDLFYWPLLDTYAAVFDAFDRFCDFMSWPFRHGSGLIRLRITKQSPYLTGATSVWKAFTNFHLGPIVDLDVDSCVGFTFHRASQCDEEMGRSCYVKEDKSRFYNVNFWLSFNCRGVQFSSFFDFLIRFKCSAIISVLTSNFTASTRTVLGIKGGCAWLSIMILNLRSNPTNPQRPAAG